MPESFEVTDEMRSWAKREHPGVDLLAQTSAFRDHEFKDSKTDWVKAWRNWIRRSDLMAAATRPAPSFAVSKYAGASAAIWEDEVTNG